MSTTNRHVVVAYNFSQSGLVALRRGIALANQAPSHVLHFVCAIDPHQPMAAIKAPDGINYAYAEQVQHVLTETIGAELRATSITGRVHFFVHARIGKAAEEILGLAREIGADLIIIGSKGLTGVERLVVGSVSEQVVRQAGCSVEVARPKTYSDVNLLDVVEVKPHHTYVPPHRYSYENQALTVRPAAWPIN